MRRTERLSVAISGAEKGMRGVAPSHENKRSFSIYDINEENTIRHAPPLEVDATMWDMDGWE